MVCGQAAPDTAPKSGGPADGLHLFTLARPTPRDRMISLPGRGSVVRVGNKAANGCRLVMALGLALADKMRNRSQVTCCLFGDGAAAEGEFHESMNLAALWKLPVLLLCENNLYAMGTRLNFTHAQTDLSKKPACYGIPAAAVDGMDVLAVEEAARAGAEHVRAGNGPYFLECRTYRFRAHSMYDPELYREKAEVEEWKKRDPIPALIAHIEEDGNKADEDVAGIEAEVAEKVAQAIAFAQAGTLESPTSIRRSTHDISGRNPRGHAQAAPER